MAMETFNGEAATQALKDILSQNEDLLVKIRQLNEKIESNFAKSGEALGGKVGDTAQSKWGEGSLQSVDKDLIAATENFFEVRVNNIIKENQAFDEATNATYGGQA